MVIAISTNKGGVLKTSITVNLAGILAANEKRVLIVDTDNQGNCLLSFGMNPDQEETTIYDVLVSGAVPAAAIRKVHDRISVIPANDDMAFFELDVLSQPRKYPKPFHLLRDRLAGIRDKYDLILIDTPPNLGLTQGNALTFADRVLIPFQPEQYSMRSLVKIVAAIEDFRANQNPGLEIMAVVPTLVDTRTVLHSQVLQECRRYCQDAGIRMTDTYIPRTIRYASSVAYDRLPSTLSDPKGQAATQYKKLAKEILA